jgi:hypothetical protein
VKSLIRFLIIFLTGVCVSCVAQGTPTDPVDQVVARYGISRQDVLALADELGVDPSDIGSFGNYHFPYNYYKYVFETFEQEHGRPPKRSEVEQLVKGYIAKCDEGPYGVSYIYYSTRTHPGDGEIAMVLSVDFRLPQPNEAPPADPIFAYVKTISLWDSSVNPPNSTYWGECIQAYLREQ